MNEEYAENKKGHISRIFHDTVLEQWASDLESIFSGEFERKKHYHLTNDKGNRTITQGEIDIYKEEEDAIYIFEVKGNYDFFERAVKQLNKMENYLKSKSKPIEKYIIIKDYRNPDSDEAGEMIYYLV